MDHMWLWICCQFMQVRYRVFAWLLSQWMFDLLFTECCQFMQVRNKVFAWAWLLSQWMFNLLFTEFSTWRKLSTSVYVLLNFSSACYSLASIYIFYSAMDDKVSFVFNILNSWEKRRWFIIWQYMDLSCKVMELDFG
jgi:hypothetical protein